MLEAGSLGVVSRTQILTMNMQTVKVRLADMSFSKTCGPSVRDELQLKKLVKMNTKSNGRVQWSVIQKQFFPKDRWGATTVSALRKLHKRRTKRNRYGRRHQHSFEQDEYENEAGYEYCEDNYGDEEVLLLSEDDFSDDAIDISPRFDGFDIVLGSDVIDYYDKEQMMLTYMLDDLVKGI